MYALNSEIQSRRIKSSGVYSSTSISMFDNFSQTEYFCSTRRSIVKELFPWQIFQFDYSALFGNERNVCITRCFYFLDPLVSYKSHIIILNWYCMIDWESGNSSVVFDFCRERCAVFTFQTAVSFQVRPNISLRVKM